VNISNTLTVKRDSFHIFEGMRNKVFSSAVAILFLGILLGIKALDYHPLAHSQDADEVNCELCTFSLLNEAISYDRVTSSPSIAPVPETPVRELCPEPIAIYLDARSHSALFGRPPPSFS
jgi:hypothetical protein